MSHFWIILILMAVLFPALCRSLVKGALTIIAAIPFILFGIFIAYEASQGAPQAIVIIALPIAVMLIAPLFEQKSKAEMEIEEKYLKPLIEARKQVKEQERQERIQARANQPPRRTLNDYWP